MENELIISVMKSEFPGLEFAISEAPRLLWVYHETQMIAPMSIFRHREMFHISGLVDGHWELRDGKIAKSPNDFAIYLHELINDSMVRFSISIEGTL